MVGKNMRKATTAVAMGLWILAAPAFAQDEGAGGSVEKPPEEAIEQPPAAAPQPRKARTPLRRDPQSLEALRACRTQCLQRDAGNGQARLRCFSACTRTTHAWQTYPAYTQCGKTYWTCFALSCAHERGALDRALKQRLRAMVKTHRRSPCNQTCMAARRACMTGMMARATPADGLHPKRQPRPRPAGGRKVASGPARGKSPAQEAPAPAPETPAPETPAPEAPAAEPPAPAAETPAPAPAAETPAPAPEAPAPAPETPAQEAPAPAQEAPAPAPEKPPASSSSKRPSRQELIRLAGQAAEKVGIPKCLAEVVVTKESGGRADLIGHDEDYPGPNNVPARTDFLRGGKKFSGATFTPEIPVPDDIPKADRKRINSQGVRNDDAGHKGVAALGGPPEFGIDWRFTHGLGLGQVTFGGERDKNEYCTKNGQKVRGTRPAGGARCMTVPELLTAEGGVEAMVWRLKAWFQSAKKSLSVDGSQLSEDLVRLTFARYAEGKRSKQNTNNTSINTRYDLFQQCTAKGSLAE
jgi:hypothetical protein